MKKLNRRNAKRLSKRATRVIGVAIPCLITWFLTGLWHGTGPNYVCWGLYYGTLITISNAFTEEFQALDARLGINTETRGWRIVQMVRTFLIFMGGRVLTSPGDLAKTGMVFFNIVMQFINAFQSFTSAFIISGGTGSPLNSTLFYSLYLYLKAFREFQMGYASAMAWVLLAIIGAITGLMFAFANKWVYYD
jgi:hypothetical protein